MLISASRCEEYSDLLISANLASAPKVKQCKQVGKVQDVHYSVQLRKVLNLCFELMFLQGMSTYFSMTCCGPDGWDLFI